MSQIEEAIKELLSLGGRALDTYRKLLESGFDEKSLEELAKATLNFGGPSNVLKSINEYGNLTRLEEKLAETDALMHEMKTNYDDLSARYSHLQASVAMCDKLLYEYKFTPEAFKAVFENAQKYGSAIDVLKALEGYGTIERIDQEIANAKEQKRLEVLRLEEEFLKKKEEKDLELTALEKRKEVLQSEVNTLIGEIESHRQRIKSLSEQADQLMTSVVNSVKEKTKALVEEIDASGKQAIEAVMKQMETLHTQVSNLAAHTLEVGEILGEAEARATQNKEIFKLLEFMRSPEFTSKDILTTMLTVFRTFEAWSKLKANELKSPKPLQTLSGQLIMKLEDEVTA